MVGIELIALYAPTLKWLWDRWTLSIWQHAHGLFIMPIAGYLILKELRKFHYLPLSSSAWGFVILMPALALHMLDAGIQTRILSAIAFLLILPGLSLLFLGIQRTKKILFPLFFLVFALPIPLAFTEPLHLILRRIATVGAAFLILKLGIMTYTEQTIIYIPNGMLLVADACSGFSTLYAAMTTACLLAYICPDRRRSLFVLIAAAPIAVVANIIRVTLLAILIYFNGFDILNTSWHTVSGLFTFIIALPAIFWLGYVPKKVR